MKRKNGPWQILKSTVKYKNPWIAVREDEVIRPDGNEGIFGTVEMVPGVSVLPIDEDGNVYLTKEFRYVVERESIEVVSGGIDQGEDPFETAKRELQEELGIIAEELIDLGTTDPFTSAILSPARLFLAKKLSFVESNQEGTEVIEMLKMPFERAFNMAMNSEITHGPSVVAILKAKHYFD